MLRRKESSTGNRRCIFSVFRVRTVLLICIFTPIVSQAQWKLLTTTGQTLHTVYFLPGYPEIGFIGGDEGGSVPSAIEKTTDGGKTWRYVGGINCIIYDFSFMDSLTGFAAAATGPFCYKTTDGGETWGSCTASINLGRGVGIGAGWGVYYDTGNGGLFLACQYGIAASWDKGATWELFHNLFDDEHFGFAFADANLGVISAWSDDGIPWYATSDGGHTWNYLPIDSTCWQPLAIQGTNTFFALTEYGANLLRTDDGWNTWQSTHTFPENAVYYADDSLRSPGCVRGDLSHLFVQLYSGIYESSDQGINWISLCGQPFRINVNNVSQLNIRFFVNEHYVYEVTYDSTIASGGCLWKLDLDSLNIFSTNFAFADSTKQKTVTAGNKVTVDFSPSTSDPIGIDSAHFVFHFDATSLLLDSLALSTSWVIRDSTTGPGYVDFFITADSDEPLQTPIITLTFNTYLSPSGLSAKVYLDSAHLFGHRLNCDCAALSLSLADSVEIDFEGCGDSTLLALMNHAAPFSIESIQPNPAQEEITVTLSGAAQPTIEMYDALGREVLAQGTTPQPPPSLGGGVRAGEGVRLDVSSVPSGSYILRVSDGEDVQSRRVVVQH